MRLSDPAVKEAIAGALVAARAAQAAAQTAMEQADYAVRLVSALDDLAVESARADLRVVS